MRRAALPLVFVGLFLGLAALLWFLKDDAAPPRGHGAGEPGSEADLPAIIPTEDREHATELRKRVRDSLGRDPRAVAGLCAVLVKVPGDPVEWLRFFRPEFDLAIRSGESEPAAAVLATLADALGEGETNARTLIEGPGYRDTWIRALESANPTVRASATRFLGKLGGRTCQARLPAMFDDPAPGVRVAAVDVYAIHGAAAARLSAAYDEEREPRVRLAVLVAFRTNRAFRGPDAQRVEAHAVANGSDAERVQAMKNIAHFRDQDQLVAVTENLSSGSALVRRGALDALRLLQDRRALPALRAMVRTEADETLRKLAERVIGELE
jgi:hypothetical protein